jgi:hypothetical protein
MTQFHSCPAATEPSRPLRRGAEASCSGNPTARPAAILSLSLRSPIPDQPPSRLGDLHWLSRNPIDPCGSSGFQAELPLLANPLNFTHVTQNWLRSTEFAFFGPWAWVRSRVFVTQEGGRPSEPRAAWVRSRAFALAGARAWVCFVDFAFVALGSASHVRLFLSSLAHHEPRQDDPTSLIIETSEGSASERLRKTQRSLAARCVVSCRLQGLFAPRVN